MRVYLAGPLFTVAERRFLASLRDSLGALPGVDVLWPGDLFADAKLERLGDGAKAHIFRSCLSGLADCDLVVAWLDGPQVDDGTAWELGHAFARGMPALGLRTDFRRAGETAHSLVNCMIECSCDKIFNDIDLLSDEVALVSREGPRNRGGRKPY
jgi:nucleoside 2-deoxyribosyltransferase